MDMRNLVGSLSYDMRRQALVGLGAGLVGLVLYAVKPGSAKQETDTVAAVDCEIPLGSPLTSACLGVDEVPEAFVGDYLSPEQAMAFVNQRAQVPLKKGQRLVPAAFPSGDVRAAEQILSAGHQSVALENLTDPPRDIHAGSQVELIKGRATVAGRVTVIAMEPFTVAVPATRIAAVAEALKDGGVTVVGCPDDGGESGLDPFLTADERRALQAAAPPPQRSSGGPRRRPLNTTGR